MTDNSSKDIRMRGFKDRTEVADVLALIDARVGRLESESIGLHQAAGRVLASDIVANADVPAFDRAAMDGYALKGEETFGADSYNPLEFILIGEAFPGRPFKGKLEAGQAVRIMTGSPLPAGADAVVPFELAREDRDRVEVCEAIPVGRHVSRRGEDIRANTSVLEHGRNLRPQDLGVLASLGIEAVDVYRRPRVQILVTGDELIPLGSIVCPFQIIDSNSVMLAPLIERDGGVLTQVVRTPDREELIRKEMAQSNADVLLVTGGSSVGKEDHAPRVLSDLGELPVHGVALRPASPTGVGFLKGRPVFLLPGNPVSCLCAYDLFAGAAIRRLGGRSMKIPYRSLRKRLARKLISAVGRVDYVRVRFDGDQVEPLATSGAAILSSTTRADGFVLVPRDSEGFPAGEEIELFAYDWI